MENHVRSHIPNFLSIYMRRCYRIWILLKRLDIFPDFRAIILPKT